MCVSVWVYTCEREGLCEIESVCECMCGWGKIFVCMCECEHVRERVCVCVCWGWECLLERECAHAIILLSGPCVYTTAAAQTQNGQWCYVCHVTPFSNDCMSNPGSLHDSRLEVQSIRDMGDNTTDPKTVSNVGFCPPSMPYCTIEEIVVDSKLLAADFTSIYVYPLLYYTADSKQLPILHSHASTTTTTATTTTQNSGCLPMQKELGQSTNNILFCYENIKNYYLFINIHL